MHHFDASQTAADESFHLPMLGLYADLEAGEGSVSLPDSFLAADPALRWRMLSGWLQGLNQARSDLLREHPELALLETAPVAPAADDAQP